VKNQPDGHKTNMYSEFSDVALQAMVAQVRERFVMKPKIAVAGFGKAGKSSLFNAIYGESVAPVGMKTDLTTDATPLEKFGIDFTDTPGFGTEKFSFEAVRDMSKLSEQHVVVHVLNGASAITAEDQELHELIIRSHTRRVTVVNKCDLLDEHEREEYAASMKEKLGLYPDQFMFVSARRGTNIPELVAHIAEILPHALRDGFVAQQTDLALKEKYVHTAIITASAISAAVALIPIPIADIIVLTPLQLTMIVGIGAYYGIEVDVKRSAEFVMTVGAGVGLREATRQLVKFVPGFGTALSAAIAFAGTFALGEAAKLWFKKGMQVDAAELQAAYKAAAASAREKYALHKAKSAAVAEKIGVLRADLAAGRITQAEFETALAALQTDDLAPSGPA
jgi:small GTP-binding protein